MYEQIKKQIFDGILALKKKGFFHIIAGSTLAKIAGFVSAFFLPRFLPTKADYGLLTYVDTIRNYVMLFNGLGIANATLRYCAHDDTDENKKGVFLASLKIGILADLVIIALTVVIFLFVPFQYEQSNGLLLFSSFMPLFYFLFNDIQLLLRATFENQRYSIYNFTYSFLLMAFQIVFALLWGVSGVMVGRYLSMGICVVLGFLLIRDLPLMKTKAVPPNREETTQLFRYGIVMLTASAASQVMNYNETFIVSAVLNDAVQVAEYKVAANILPISLFLLEAILVFVLPYFIQHIKDKKWIWENYKKLFWINGAVMTVLHIGLYLFAGVFIYVVAGQRYLNAVPLVRMFLIASWIQAVFRGIAGNILAVTGEEKFNLKVNVFFVLVHAVVDYAAIKTLGLYGAAIAMILVYLLSGMVMTLHLRNVCQRESNDS